MGTEFFVPLFTISVEHDYFADGQWRGLDFVPDAESERMAGLPSLLIRQTDNGVTIYVDEDNERPLRKWAADAEGELRFRFMVRARDKDFANYTDYPLQDRGAIPCFDNREPGKKTEEGIGLSRGALVSEADCRPIDALIAEGVLDARERLIPPDFIVTIYVDLEREQGFGLRAYRIAFGTRKSFWKYYLLGDMNQKQFFIVDLENKVEFLSCDEVMLAGNRPARVFRSNQTLPLLERSAYRFQLKERGANGERVLIKRLPLASKARLGSEMIDGRNELVLENFVQY